MLLNELLYSSIFSLKAKFETEYTKYNKNKNGIKVIIDA